MKLIDFGLARPYIKPERLGKHNWTENDHIEQTSRVKYGNVVFASSRGRWAFTTASFAGRVYNKKGKNIKSTNNRSKARRNKETKDEKDARIKRVASSLQDTDRFAKRLWGDWYSNPTTNAISRTPPTATGSKRTFVQYVLEPLWKVRNKKKNTDGSIF